MRARGTCMLDMSEQDLKTQPEVLEKATRRPYSKEYKERILGEADGCSFKAPKVRYITCRGRQAPGKSPPNCCLALERRHTQLCRPFRPQNSFCTFVPVVYTTGSSYVGLPGLSVQLVCCCHSQKTTNEEWKSRHLDCCVKITS